MPGVAQLVPLGDVLVVVLALGGPEPGALLPRLLRQLAQLGLVLLLLLGGELLLEVGPRLHRLPRLPVRDEQRLGELREALVDVHLLRIHFLFESEVQISQNTHGCGRKFNDLYKYQQETISPIGAPLYTKLAYLYHFQPKLSAYLLQSAPVGREPLVERDGVALLILPVGDARRDLPVLKKICIN